MSDEMAGQNDFYDQGYSKGYSDGVIFVIDQFNAMYEKMAIELSDKEFLKK